MKQCKGEGQVICKRCWEIGLTTTAYWKACDLYMVDGYEGQYCYQHAKELEEKVVKGKIMNKQKILEEIQKTEEHLTNMKKMLEECEYERWKPKDCEKYWYVNEACNVCFANNAKDEFDIDNINSYNCFKTREQAEAEAEKILVRRMLEDIARRLNKSQKLDWTKYQGKYFIELCHGEDLSIDRCTICKRQGTVYCLDETFLDVAIREIGKERLKNYLRNQ